MKSKTRSTPSSCAREWFTTNASEEIVGTPGSGTVSYTASKEAIDYGSGFETYNVCVHSKVSQTLGTSLHRWPVNDIGYHSNSSHPGPADTPESILATVKTYLYYDSYDWLAFCKRAVASMTPSMESGFSLVNFVHELREVKTLSPYYSVGKTGRKKIKFWWDKEKSLFENFSGLMLNYSFGLVPFIGDMKRLYKGLTTLQDRLSDLHQNAGKLQIRRYSEEEEPFSWDVPEYISSDTFRVRDWFKVSHLTRTAVMRYTYQLPELSRFQWQLKAILDTLGVQLNAGILWEAIPYSFVLDWFLGVGDFLVQLRKKWIPITLFIKEFGTSVKFVGEYQSELQRYSTYGESDWDERASGTFKWYARRPRPVDDRFFDLNAVIKTGDMTLRKFVLGSLLLEQRIPRFKRGGY